MKNTILAILLIMFFSCSKVNPYQEAQQAAQASVTATVETTAQLSSIYIPEDESGWITSHTSGRVGLFHAYQTISHTSVNSYMAEQYGGKVPVGTMVKINTYECLSGNGIAGDTWDTAINNPITRSGWADYITVGGIQPTPLSINVYSNGDLFLGRKKDEFYYTNSDQRIGATKGIYYPGQNVMWWGWGDTYRATAIIPEEDGYYVIAVSLDYNKPNPKTSLLPIRVTGLTSVVDTAGANAAKPAANYKAVIQRGKIKGVNISWQGSGYAYCIERDGQMILKWADVRSFFDPSGSKFSQYKIITRAQGRIPDAETPTFKVSAK
jgi:hypothetical protein